MEFEYDPTKSASNKEKHGIDFEEAQKLWEDGNGLVARTSSKDEDRFYFIGTINNKNWTAIFTVREEKIRLISARRSRKDEKENYYSRRI